MGAINNTFIQNKISFSKIEEILNMFTTQSVNKSQNIKILQEIGLLKEYSYIKSKKFSEDIIYFSKKNKSVNKYIDKSKLKSNFVEWTEILFDINDQDQDPYYIQLFNQKLEYLKNYPLNKSFFQNNLKKHLKNHTFNKLISYGIPNNLRDFVWDVIITEKYTNNKPYNFEEEKKEYTLLLKNNIKNPQIEKDLNRTFSKESEQTNNNIQILRNLLQFMSKYNNGYCQGMNFIVGFLLKQTKFDEIKTYYILKSILPDIKGLFEVDFPLLKKNISIFDNNFQELYPKLYKHLKKNDVYNELWVGKWLQALFTLSLPFEETCNIWDNLIIKGFNYIIYICLSIINSVQEDLLKLDDSSDILAYLKEILNPKEIISKNCSQLEKVNNYIIPLNEILYKASKIEKKIKENNDINTHNERNNSCNHLNKSNLILKNAKKTKNEKIHDNDSDFSKESDNSIKHSFSSKSTCSSNSCHLNLLRSPNLTNTQNNINNIDNLKLSLYNAKFGLNHNNETFKSLRKKSTFYSSKNAKTCKLFDNIDLVNNRQSFNYNSNNNNNINNMRYSYNNNINNNYLMRTNQYNYYNNNNHIDNININYNIIDNNQPYYNYLIYYS